MIKVIAACGNDCSVCPRYVPLPYEKTEEQLHNTAILWMKTGYRDQVVANEEIVCTEEEYIKIKGAFFEKEGNLKKGSIAWVQI